jgi:hypothetical protein
LIAVEAARAAPSGNQVTEAVRVCDKLRLPLAKIVGHTGFASLLSRTLALAKARHPALAALSVAPDGTLAGLCDVPPDPGPEAPGAVVVSQLLGLLVTFIGEPLTLRLVRDAWPNAPLEPAEPRTEELP